MTSEPKGWKEARMARLSMQYPELGMASPTEVMQVDAQRIALGQPVSQFSMCIMRLAREGSSRLD